MQSSKPHEKLELLPRSQYRGIDKDDPLRFYFVPIFGRMYRRRVELCLNECRGGGAVLEVGFGSGSTFLNLSRKYQRIHGLDLNSSVREVEALFRRHGVETDLANGSLLEMPYGDGEFDTVLLISILEHLHPSEQRRAFAEVRRVLKRGGQVVYGVPIERAFMVFMFRLLGYDIRQHHFSTEEDIREAAGESLDEVRVARMRAIPSLFGEVYEVGHFRRAT